MQAFKNVNKCVDKYLKNYLTKKKLTNPENFFSVVKTVWILHILCGLFLFAAVIFCFCYKDCLDGFFEGIKTVQIVNWFKQEYIKATYVTGAIASVLSAYYFLRKKQT